MAFRDRHHWKVITFCFIIQIFHKTVVETAKTTITTTVYVSASKLPTELVVNHDQQNENDNFCRSRDGFYPDTDYKIKTCYMCYTFLFETVPPVKYIKCNDSDSANCINNSRVLHPTIDDEYSMDVTCQELGSALKCEQWRSCCKDAWKCCEEQKNNSKPLDGYNYCPQTWDGWTCWNFTRSNVKASQSCPSFLNYAEETSKVTKQCTSNASWYIVADKGEWSDYTDCVTGVTKLLEVCSAYCLLMNICPVIEFSSKMFITCCHIYRL